MESSGWTRGNHALSNHCPILVIPTGAYPDFLPRHSRNDNVCGFLSRKAARSLPAPLTSRGNLGEQSGGTCGFLLGFHGKLGHGRSRAPFDLSAAARETTGAAPAAAPSSVAVEAALSNVAVQVAPNSGSSAWDVPRSSSAGCTTALEDRPRSAEDSSLAAVVG
jgi:hypothetical protein